MACVALAAAAVGTAAPPPGGVPVAVLVPDAATTMLAPVAAAWPDAPVVGVDVDRDALDVRTVRYAAPDAAGDAARAAVADGAWAVVCCETEAATTAVADALAGRDALLVSPYGGAVRTAAGRQVVLGLAPAEALRAFVRDAYAEGARAIGVMTPEGIDGDVALEALRGTFAAGDLTLRGVGRYPAGATPLTPEALWVATRLPDVVVAWDDAAGAQAAWRALRARGWNGPVYAPAAVLDVPSGPPRGGGPEGEVRLAVPPAAVWTALPAGDPARAWAIDARTVGGGRLGSAPGRSDGARAYDALALVARAAAAGPTDAAALRAATFALGPLDLAAGRYAPSPRTPWAGTAEGTRPARLVAGRLQPR